MRRRNKLNMTISEQLEAVKETACERCVYLAVANGQAQSEKYKVENMEEICRGCRLNEI